MQFHYNYPVMVFKQGHKAIYAKDRDIGIVSKGGEKFYSNLTLIDSLGNVYTLTGASIKGVAPLRICLRHLQRVWELDLEFSQAGTITLDELKAKIMQHVSKHHKYWLQLDNVPGIQAMVDRTNTFAELIRLFH
ncbi:MAG: hypothetical protein QM762_13250 [Chryseolinea sp.]